LSHSSVVHRLVMSFLPSDLALAHEGSLFELFTETTCLFIILDSTDPHSLNGSE
jgi:hypothetical protein